jgi:hypothetical protein
VPDLKGKVIGQNPPLGTRVPKWSKVHMLGYSGPPLPVGRTFNAEQLAQRSKQWEFVSHCTNVLQIQGDTYYFTVTLQQLGRLDCKLIAEDLRFATLSEPEQRSTEETERGFDHLGVSMLWVLGGFQAVYTLGQLVEGSAQLRGLKNEIGNVRKDFGRLREPFAKMRRQPKADDDFPFPYQGVRLNNSVCWAVSPNNLIARLYLSERLLKLFLAVEAHGKS